MIAERHLPSLLEKYGGIGLKVQKIQFFAKFGNIWFFLEEETNKNFLSTNLFVKRFCILFSHCDSNVSFRYPIIFQVRLTYIRNSTGKRDF